MNRFFLFFVLSCLAISLFSAEIEIDVQFSQPRITSENGYLQVTMGQTVPHGVPGEPQLPARAIRVLLPPGEVVSGIEIEREQHTRNIDQPVFPAQRHYPLSQLTTMQPEFTQPDPALYARHPVQINSDGKQGFYRGYSIYNFLVHPVTYYPEENRLEIATRMNIRIQTQPADARQDIRSPRHVQPDRLRSMVDNPDMILAYSTAQNTRLRDQIDYLIITDQSFVDDFLPLAAFKDSLGIITEIVTIQEIEAVSAGNDTQERIRNYLIDAYENNGLTYALLAGDDEYIPHRGFYVNPGYNMADNDVASDMYYSCLDGTWNDDGDNRWGEWAEIDWFADIMIGRAPVDSQTEIQNFIYKQLMYQTQPVVDDLLSNMLIGEDLGWTPWGMHYMEEVRLGSSNHGYTTVGIPDHIECETLYDHDSYWSTSTLYSMLNEGRNLVGHLGHCNVHYNIKFYTPDVTNTNFTNNGINHNFYVLYTQGCYCNSFDNRDDSNYHYQEDCIAEQWTLLENGPVCYVGNTRYGWGDGSGTNGPSQHLHREFYDALYGEGITRIAEIHEDSRLDTQPFVTNNSTLLWSYFECTLLGDPTLDIWTLEPYEITIQDLPEIFTIGSQEISFTVDAGENEVAGLNAALFFDDMLLGRTTLDDTGVVDLSFDNPVETEGNLYIRIHGHNILPHEEELMVIAPDQAYIVPETLELDGDNNGTIDWNETVNLRLTAENVGQTGSGEVTAILETDCEAIEILTPVITFSAIDAQATMQADSCFVVRTLPVFEPGTVANFNLIITEENTTAPWIYTVSYPLQIPDIQLDRNRFIEIQGNGNGMVEAGENIQSMLEVVNNSAIMLDTLRIALTTDHPLVTVTPGNLTYVNVGSMAAIPLSNFAIELSPDLAPLDNIAFYLDVRCEREFHFQQIINLQLPVFEDSFEQEGFDWQHSALNGYGDQWHRSNNENHTQDGTWSYKCGSTGNGDHDSNLLSALVSPVISIPENAVLHFWHKISAELNSNNGNQAYDGGFVEISVDGSGWFQISPIGGYPYYSSGNTGSTVPGNTPMWSGELDWEPVFFDFGDYDGSDLQVRFVFSSDGSVTGAGWWIDDVRLQVNQDVLPPENLAAEFEPFEVHLMWNSPDCPVESYIIERDNEVIAENIASHQFADNVEELEPGIHTYRIATFWNGNTSGWSEPVEIDIVLDATQGEAPAYTTALLPNYPNPFNPETTISFTLNSQVTSHPVKLQVYNIRGQLVRTLVNGHLASGIHNIVWNGRDDHNTPLSGGIYLYRLDTGERRITRKMLMLK